MRKEAPAAFAKISFGACGAPAACSPPFPAEDQIAKFKLKKWCSHGAFESLDATRTTPGNFLKVPGHCGVLLNIADRSRSLLHSLLSVLIS